jgi:hypothetical protein
MDGKSPSPILLFITHKSSRGEMIGKTRSGDEQEEW